MRFLIPFILVFVGGATMGWFASTSDSPSTPAPSSTLTADETDANIATLEEELAWLQSDRDALEGVNQQLETQLAELLTMRTSAVKMTEPSAEDEATEETATSPTESEVDARRRERREAMVERRQEMTQVFQDRFSMIMDEQFAKLDDPAQVEGMSALLEWRDYQQELRGQMRDAQTDDERDEILAEMSSAQSAAKQVLKDQQDAVLRNLALEQGISGMKKQDAFVKQMRQTLKSPFFEMERMLVGTGGTRGAMMGGRGQRGGGQRN